MEEKNNLKFIQGFTKIKVSQACRFFGYNQSNLMKGKCGREAGVLYGKEPVSCSPFG